MSARPIYNFSAGPAVLPEAVLRTAQQEMLDYNGTGFPVMAMSHRSEMFLSILHHAEQDLRTLLNIPSNYKILFLQGGAVSDGLSNEEIEDLIAQRKQARADKNWAESDRIRDLLNEHKIILEDNAGGTTWRRG